MIMYWETDDRIVKEPLFTLFTENRQIHLLAPSCTIACVLNRAIQSLCVNLVLCDEL
jgi:hypothetical protein